MTGKERKIATITGSIFWGAFQIAPALDALKSDLKLFESLKSDCGKQVDAFIAGNDEEVLQTVKELVSTAGFNPIVGYKPFGKQNT